VTAVYRQSPSSVHHLHSCPALWAWHSEQNSNVSFLASLWFWEECRRQTRQVQARPCHSPSLWPSEAPIPVNLIFYILKMGGGGGGEA
jgi:hypothetical protein